MITLLGTGSVTGGIQQIASQPMQIRFVEPLFSGLNDLHSFGEAIQTLHELPQLAVCRGKGPESVWRSLNGPGSPYHREPFCEQGEAFLWLAKHSQ
jgi:hypothetical protein